MVTSATKKSLCDEYKGILELVFLFGKGVMYKSHIERLATQFWAWSEQTTWHLLKLLEQGGLIERRKTFGVVYIKLRKFAITYLTGKSREEIRSINITQEKRMFSAYIGEIFLLHMNKIITWERATQIYYRRSSLFLLRGQVYVALSELAESKVMNQHIVDKEVKRLKCIELRMRTKDHVEVQPDKEFDLNSMHDGWIYFDYATSKSKILHVAIIDVTNRLTPGGVAKKIANTAHYLITTGMLSSAYKLKFTIYVASEERLQLLSKKIFARSQIGDVERIGKFLIDHELLRNTNVNVFEDCHNWDIVNLNLEKTLFRNQKLFVGSM
ncbi:hypothetical protein EHS13_02165 [Paenibacillus psychroresistens]|uniref:Uncharacterized protein n=1 Tax=Paenibacillus psychroresistens TaxID=1778678 RepID=A0A6B8REA5_9BACL|nr:hypothetical protein [Paenibacillus psychroresistens]QGQ93792.1 hypothetical protein EHS13_02165 [Paenibacillus psychroresistens]